MSADHRIPTQAEIEAVLDDAPSILDAAKELERRYAKRDGPQRVLVKGVLVDVFRARGIRFAAELASAILGSEDGLVPEDDTPSEHPVNGHQLLELLRSLIECYCVIPNGAGDTLALWILHTWVYDRFWTSPYLFVQSPVARCGKSTLMFLLSQLVRRPLPTSNITPAALFRTVEASHPTLIIDEADTFLRSNEELRCLLNAGHTKGLSWVIRVVGETHQLRRFDTWCPKAIAAIGHLPETIEDRSIIIPMRRKRKDETTKSWSMDPSADLVQTLRSACARWAADHGEAVGQLRPAPHPDLHDRAQDNWRPLFAIAERVGNGWPERAREAAEIVSGQRIDTPDLKVLLLEDLREIFKGEEFLATSVILEKLLAMEERPWATVANGKPLTAHRLGRMLSEFHIEPEQKRVDGTRPRGYTRSSFEDAWKAYLA